MNSEFVLSQGAGQKLEFAVQRNGGSAEDIEYLSTGSNFRAVTLLRTGEVKLVARTEDKLLEFVTIVTVPSIKKFVADEHFKGGGTVDGVRVFLGNNFKKRFGGKVEENVAGCDIRVHKLLKASRDLPIRAEIGKDKEETFLAHLWHFLKLQSTKGRWFVFYIRDAKGWLRAVDADRRGDGWGVDADSVMDRDRWFAVACVCSR